MGNDSSLYEDLSELSRRVRLIKRIKIEKRLDRIRYKEMSLGRIIGFGYKNVPDFSFFSLAGYKYCREIAHAVTRVRFRRTQLQAADVLCVHYSDKQKDWSILDGVHSELPASISMARIAARKLALGFSFGDFIAWIVFWLVKGRAIRQELREILKEESLDLRLERSLFRFWFINSLYLEGLRTVLQRSRPKLVIFTYDRDQYSSLVASCVRGLGIHSASIIHGSSFHLPCGFLPFLTDQVWVWGDQHLNCFAGYGVSRDSMCVVGFPRFGLELPTKNVVRERFSLPSGVRVALLASEPGSDEQQVLEAFLDALNEVETWVPVVKLHPSSASLSMDVLKKRYPSLVIVGGDGLVCDVLAIADVVVGLRSTLLLEALSVGTPVVVFNPANSEEEGIGAYLHEYGKAPYASASGELEKIFEEATIVGMEHAFNARTQLDYFNIICAYCGGHSDRRIIDKIVENLTK